MVIFARGADPEVLDAAASRFAEFGAQGGEIRGTVATVSGAVTTQWSGADSQLYASHAPVIDGRLADCSATLSALGETLRRNAAAQRHTSGGGQGG